MSPKMILFFLIAVILSTTLIVSADPNVPKKIDCTTTYNLWETSLEEFEKYCEPKFCQCFTANGCTEEWSQNFADGLAMMWYFMNVNQDLTRYCGGAPPNGLGKSQRLYMNPTPDKQFFIVRTSAWGGIDENQIALKTGTVEVLMTDRFFAPTIATKGLIAIEVYITNPVMEFQKDFIDFTKHVQDASDPGIWESWKAVNKDNFYGTSLRMSFTDRSGNTKSIDNIVFGRFGGPTLHEYRADVQFNKYTDLNKNTREDYYMRVKASDMTKDYSLTLNKRIGSIKIISDLYICLGRKINPITKRTHWTGEGCRPVPYYKPKSSSRIFLSHYDIYCHCNFQSLGINYVDEDPNPKLIPEFQSPEPSKRWSKRMKIIDSSGATTFAVIFTSVILGICLLLLLLTVGAVIYYKLLHSFIP